MEDPDPDDLIDIERLLANRSYIPGLKNFGRVPSADDANERPRKLCPNIDYDPARAKMDVWMICGRHHYFTLSLANMVKKRLHDFECTLPLEQAIMVRGISVETDSSLRFNVGVNKFSPDAQFRYSGPSLVFEITNGQTSSRLSDKVRKFIAHTEGQVRAVVCFDAQYGHNQQTSTVSV
jgi:hypothetical protein